MADESDAETGSAAKQNPQEKPADQTRYQRKPGKKKLGNTHTRTRAHAQKETSRRCGSDALPWRRRRRALRMQMSHANELSPSLVETASRFFFSIFFRAPPSRATATPITAPLTPVGSLICINYRSDRLVSIDHRWPLLSEPSWFSQLEPGSSLICKTPIKVPINKGRPPPPSFRESVVTRPPESGFALPKKKNRENPVRQEKTR